MLYRPWYVTLAASVSKVMKDESGRSKGFGFVCFESIAAAGNAIVQMNGRSVGEKILYVAVAQSKTERQAMLQRGLSLNMGATQLPPTTMANIPTYGTFPPVPAYPSLGPIVSLPHFPWTRRPGHQGGILPLNTGAFHRHSTHPLNTTFGPSIPKSTKRNSRKVIAVLKGFQVDIS